MSPEERDQLIDFILQSQANAATRHEEAMKRMDEFHGELREHAVQIQSLATKLDTLAAVSYNLVEVARIHSRRLDRLEGLNP